MTIGEIREPSFLVLAALADGDKHGYALIREAEQLSGGRVRLKVGTLYAALDRLGEQGLVAVAGEEVVDGRLRRYFHLTEQGAETVRIQSERMQRAAQQAMARLAARPAVGGIQ